MGKYIRILITGIVVSMFYFPFEFTFLPGINTKMAMAGLGLVLFVLYFVIKRDLSLPRSLFILLCLACIVSLVSLISITYNKTPDTSYVTYIVSAAVWLSAAFVACIAIYLTHGRIDVPLITYYLIGVCVFQCIIAIVIDSNATVQHFVDRFVVGGEFYHNIHRLYGIGAGLDIAGNRFSCVLVAIGFFLAKKNDALSIKQIFILFFSFAVIVVLGNMISRTTLIGSGLGLAIIFIFGTDLFKRGTGLRSLKLFGTISLILLIGIPVVVFLYRTIPQFYEWMRFGFEGFFSLAEKGEWEVSSNDMLQSMVIWPDELKTWIIGDGYFISERLDPYYLGPVLEAGYYKGTDIGYCRFLFYFGVIGLLTISSVIIYACVICCNKYKEYFLMFIAVLLAGFIMWAKSATDIFLFFALYIMASYIKEETSIDNAEG